MINLMPALEALLPIIVILLLALYIKEFSTRKTIEKSGQQYLEDAKQRGFEVIHQAIKKAQEIEGEAEISSLKIAAENKIHSQKFSAEFEKYLQGLQLLAQNSLSQNEEAIKNHTNTFFEKFEENLSTYLTSTQQQSSKALDLEMQAARNLIETYKNNQLKLVDENILAILETTLSLVLAKKLSLQDQMELVFDSLEKAKAEKFIG